MDRSIPRPTSRSSPRTLLDLATVAVQSHPDHKYSHPDIGASDRITLPPLTDVARPRTNFWRSFPPPPSTSAGTSASRDISGIHGHSAAPELGFHSVSTVNLAHPFTLASSRFHWETPSDTTRS